MKKKLGQRSLRSGSYAVGFGKPPVHARFKPGLSGNPRGRPKTQKSDGQILADILNARVRVNEAGEMKQITRREALYKNLIAKALQGNPSAQRLLLQIMTELGATTEDPKAMSVAVRFVKAGEVETG